MRTMATTIVMLVFAFASSTYASTITLATPGIVGLNDMNGFTDDNNPGTRLVYANKLIGMVGLGAKDPDPIPADGSNIIGYQTSTIKDYTGGPFAEAATVTGTNIVPANAGYVLAKYNGPNAGYVLFYIPDWGGGTSIPSTAGYATWKGGASQEYGLSGYNVYTTVPDGGSVVMLLGTALLGLAGLRRLLS